MSNAAVERKFSPGNQAMPMLSVCAGKTFRDGSGELTEARGEINLEVRGRIVPLKVTLD
jgi:hypothetical protein